MSDTEIELRVLHESLLKKMKVVAYPRRGTGEEHMTPDEVYAFARQAFDRSNSDFEKWMEKVR